MIETMTAWRWREETEVIPSGLTLWAREHLGLSEKWSFWDTVERTLIVEFQRAGSDEWLLAVRRTRW